MQVLVLASGSTYRANLLARLGLPFVQCAPDINETPLPSELPTALVQRLAQNKAAAIENRCWHEFGSLQNVETPAKSSSVGAVKPEIETSVIIASDQVASLDGAILGKPLSHGKAVQQLRAASGKQVSFLTAVTLYNRNTKVRINYLDKTDVQFRSLTGDEIERYLRHDTPYDCAGSFKVESLGISLFESVANRDPTALEGLPLIAVSKGLREMGIPLP